MCDMPLRRYRVWLGVCIALGIFTLLIWGNSMRTAAQSAQQSSGVLAMITPWLDWLGMEANSFHTILRKL